MMGSLQQINIVIIVVELYESEIIDWFHSVAQIMQCLIFTRKIILVTGVWYA